MMMGKRFTSAINYGAVLHVMGWMLLLECVMLLFPAAVGLIYGDKDIGVFLLASLCCLVPGVLLALPGRRKVVMVTRRESYLLTGLCWALFSAFGMLPLIWSPSCSLSVADAFFETMSGFTTTGATVIGDVDACSKGVIFWRSEIQCLGGMGIILFTLALLPVLNRSDGIWMFNTETTGITHDKIHPRIGHTAKTLWMIYIGLTIACTLLLWAGPVDFFDSLCLAMSSLSTGGFTPRSAGLGYWDSGYVNAILTVFMFLGGVNFILLYRLLSGHAALLWKNDVFRAYCLLLLCGYAVTLISMAVQGEVHSVRNALVDPMCQLVSAFTSTGVTSMPYESMGAAIPTVIILLMAIGACAGSTTGGLKVDRFLAMMKSTRNETMRSLYPNRLQTVKVNGTILTEFQMSKILAFATWYLLLCAAVTLITTLSGYPLFDSMFGTLSCISNNGLGYGICGNGGDFSVFPDLSKWLMSLLMMAGRLELFTVLVLFVPSFWRR